MRTRLLVAGLLASLTACGAQGEAGDQRDRAADLATVERITDRLAESISRLDAEGAALDFALDGSIAYISDGRVIRGVEYIDVLSSFYSSVDSLQFEWTEKEIWFPTPESAVFVGWASIRAKVGGEDWVDDPAIFTSLLSVDSSGDWRFNTTHKTSTSR